MPKMGFMKNGLEKMRAPGIRPFLFLRGILAAASMATLTWTDAARADDQDLDWVDLWGDCLVRQRGLMWNKETRRALSAYAERFEKLRNRPLAEKCAAINAAVNKDIAFVWDQWNYGIEERFAAPAQTLREGRGDCEDFAIMKYFLLRHLDVPADHLLLAVVDIPDGKHMVLLAGEALRLCQPGDRGMFMRTRPTGILVLDNKNPDKAPRALESAPYRDAHILMNERKALKKSGDNVWRMEREYKPVPLARLFPIKKASPQPQ
jgi:predicted transglutaminase-like cysteine proteinase